MVSVVDELKGKLAEIDARLVAIRGEAATLEGQRAAFETVIVVYDPSFSTAGKDWRLRPMACRPGCQGGSRLCSTALGKDGLVRSAGDNGRHRVWEIAR